MGRNVSTVRSTSAYGIQHRWETPLGTRILSSYTVPQVTQICENIVAGEPRDDFL
jgi:hypothetical protein